MNRDRFDEAVSNWEDSKKRQPYVSITCVYMYICLDPPKSTKIEADTLKEGIISAVKFTKV